MTAAAHWDILKQDLRYTARTLTRARGFAATAIFVTAIGVGPARPRFRSQTSCSCRHCRSVPPTRWCKCVRDRAKAAAGAA